MELSEFISKTLIEIKTGLRNANEYLAKQEGKILGQDVGATFLLQSCSHNEKTGYIDFDVAVTVSQEDSKSADGGIRVAIAKIGGDIKNIDKTESVSRIKFHIGSSLTTG